MVVGRMELILEEMEVEVVAAAVAQVVLQVLVQVLLIIIIIMLLVLHRQMVVLVQQIQEVLVVLEL